MSRRNSGAVNLERYEVRIGFEDKTQRQIFVRNVYLILCVLLAVTFAIVAIIRYVPEIRSAFLSLGYWGTLGFGLGLMFVMILMICMPDLRHKSPQNYICLGIYTILMSMLISCVVVHAETHLILISFGITFGIVFCLSLFATQTRCDFTPYIAIPFALTIVLCIMGIVSIFVYDKVLHIVYASLGIAVFSIYLIIDTQMIITGKHKYKISVDEYILGAMHLYIDVIMIFLYVLSLMSATSE